MSGDASDLRRALDFDAADLAANRRGLLSPAQIRRLQRERRRSATFTGLAFVLLALLATALLYWGQLSANALLGLSGIGLTIVNALLVGYAGRAIMRIGGDLRDGRATAISGETERVLRRGRQRDNYLLRIAGRDLPATKEVCLGFRHRGRYRMYLTSHTSRLLSAEALDADDAPQVLK